MLSVMEADVSMPTEPSDTPTPPAFRFIDLFAGIGGIRTGLQRAGGRCVFTVEFDRFAMQTYSANFGRLGSDGKREQEPPRDIYDVVVSRDVPVYEVLAAGFPCQPFSIAGVSKKLSLGRKHGFEDKKSGNLFFQIVRLIDEAETPPPVLFLENVKHLTRHDGGKTFRVIHDTLEDRGYNFASKVIDAAAWVPQHRERTFMVALHRDVYGDQFFEFPDYPEDAPWPKLRSIFREDEPVDPKYTLTDHLWGYLFDYAAKHKAAGNGFGFGLVGPDDIARTLSARYHKDGSEILHHVLGTGILTVDENGNSSRRPGFHPRRLTPRECARLMGYGEDFVIPVSDTQAYRQFGNSVVVPVIEFLAKAMVAQGVVPVPSDGGTGARAGGDHERGALARG